jgi:TRAP-type mannitol/chloroaromatic compound transport system permease large subunit
MSGAMLTVMLVLFAASIPVAVAIGLAAIVGIAGYTNFPLIVAAQQLFVSLDRFPLAAIPFFILAGNLMDVGRHLRRLVDFAKSIVGGVQGGLPATCIVTCMIFARHQRLLGGDDIRHRSVIDSGLTGRLPVPSRPGVQATRRSWRVIIPHPSR